MSTNRKLTDFEFIGFDVYGTIADWDGGIYTALQPILLAYSPFVRWSREHVLNTFSDIHKRIQAEESNTLYSDLLAKSHEALEAQLKKEGGGNEPDGLDPDRHRIFGESIRDWPLFPDSPAALHQLAKRYKLVVLSNVDNKSFKYTLAKISEGIDSPDVDTSRYTRPEDASERFWFPQTVEGSKSPFTLIVTAEDVHSWKPDLHGFHETMKCIQDHPMLLNSPGGDDMKDKLLWVACSVFHDIEPTKAMGITNVWIDRRGESENAEGANHNWSWKFDTLAEFVEAVEKEKSG